MKIAICIPFYKFMDSKAVESLITMMAGIHNRGDSYVPILCHSLYIEKARSFLVKTALEKVPDADYILCIDTDHVYSAAALYALIGTMQQKNLDMLAAAYTARSMPGVYAHMKADPLGKIEKIKQNGETGVVRCDVVGFGFVVFRPKFLREMWAKYGHELFSGGVHDGKMYTGDDVRFCEMARREGHPVQFHAGVKVGHLSQVVL